MRSLFGVLAFALGLIAAPVLAQPSPAATGPIDGLRVVFCGTSGPLPIVGRAKPASRSRRAATSTWSTSGPRPPRT